MRGPRRTPMHGRRKGVAGVTMTVRQAATVVPADQYHSDNDEDAEMEDAEHEVDDLSLGKSKKKRKVIKITDKKYECPEPDCGKAYSRAEHLYRHQLNHNPKQVYHCDFPGCNRHFVRADLCARHKERHTAKGSHLQRKDAFMNSQRAITSSNAPHSESGSTKAISQSTVDSAHSGACQVAESYMRPPSSAQAYTIPVGHYSQRGATSDPVSLHAQGGAAIEPHMNGSANAYPRGFHATVPMMPPPSPDARRRYSAGAQSSPSNGTDEYNSPQALSMSATNPLPPSSVPTLTPLYTPQQQFQSAAPPEHIVRSPASGTYSSMPTLPPFGLPPSYNSVRQNNAMQPASMQPIDQFSMPGSRGNSVADFNSFDQFAVGYSMPVFGGDGFHRSPQYALDDALFNHLLENGGLDIAGPPSPPMHNMQYMPPRSDTQQPNLEHDGTTNEGTAADNGMSCTVPMTAGMDLSLRESNISERKQARLLKLIRSFNDSSDSSDRKTREEILSGDVDNPNHPLSNNMLKTFLTSFWLHIHHQMPIMHRPTFNSETCPDLLLLTMLCLGACCLERTHSAELIKDCAELAFFAAYHVRWEMFKDVEFRPTARLWTFQTMLLLELFEKMYSTRSLHERAHIHHATTLTVMRRGSSLVGRSTIESPAGTADPTRTPPGPEGSINTSGVNTPDARWNRWITAEATRRVAFAAFILDSTHATLFGHAAAMSPHDIDLPLPCDEVAWSATSMGEVQRNEASLAANGLRSITFKEGLQRTLHGQKVHTNVFGRIILMAGLLSVSWHTNQRDLQVTSLKADSELGIGNPTRWRRPLMHAFDFWKRNFDESLGENGHWPQVSNPENKSRCHADHRDNVFESRTCLHSLAHMAMHVDIIDCEVFAGAERVLGRVVTKIDRKLVQDRMRDQWAPSARARDATFYALRFLCEVLLPEYNLTGNTPRTVPPASSDFSYSARDDHLLNRPWILYFAVMIVWSYGYALDGPIANSQNYALPTREAQVHDMQQYLMRVGTVPRPDDLERLQDRNMVVGLLVLLQDCFRQPRWELLHEASEMLQLCIGLLLPDQQLHRQQQQQQQHHDSEADG